MNTNLDQLEQLSKVVELLNPKDRQFAESLLSQSVVRHLSDKQHYWVGVLLEKATRKTPTVAVMECDTVSGIIELINRNNKAKFPAIRFLVGEKELKLTKAGERARVPGSLNIVLVGETEKTWYGRIHTNGEFEPSRAIEGREAVVAALKRVAADPEGEAREYGRKTGHCCFCGLTLDDERSLLMGYGPICAANYQLNWGDRPSEE